MPVKSAGMHHQRTVRIFEKFDVCVLAAATPRPWIGKKPTAKKIATPK
jgi:hypothetical protein